MDSVVSLLGQHKAQPGRQMRIDEESQASARCVLFVASILRENS